PQIDFKNALDEFFHINELESSEKAKEISPKEDEGGKMTLFYGTNRNRTTSTDINKLFGDQLDKLKYGFCDVSIPRGHILGELERPFKFLFIKFSEVPGEHVVLKSLDELSKEDFLNRLSKSIDNLPEKSAIVFIHGYNTTFAEAARRTAQIAYDTPFYGISGFFSWPSSGTIKAYLKDGENAEASVSDLEKFIEEIVIQTKIEKLHLIAHSMGNKLLTLTLNNLADKSSFKEKLNIINQIVLGAPDIDQNVFKNNILPKFKNIGAQRTLYSSDKDKAIDLSEYIRGGLVRLGDAGESLFVSDGLDTIDASNIKSDKVGHAYIFETKELLADLHFLLSWGFKPEQRRLKARKKSNLIYWLFPE
ncbi:MAG: alpha/beta hydrolase, partial [Ignavibacteria bacterium]|nr:alpha/beta hydrolase [Ignavibacteria bacterium]